MVHALLALSLLMFAGWGAGMVGVFDQHLAWFFMVVGWFVFMAWCYAYYLVGTRHDRRRFA